MSRLNVYRESVLDLGYDFAKTQVLQAAFEFDLFERLGEGAKTARTLSEELKANPESLELFLNALTSLGFLVSEGGGFRNTKYGLEIFLQGKPLYVGDMVRLQGNMVHGWLELKTSVLTGKAIGEGGFPEMDDQAAAAFARAMHNTAMGHAEFLASKLSLKSVKTLLDLGGGPGTFTIQFLKANPELKAVIFDLPKTFQTTRSLVNAEGLSGRVECQAGDFNQDEIKGNFDVCFLSHIIHGQSVEKNKKLFAKIFAHLNSGGKLIVQDFFLNSDKKSPQFAALFSLLMLINTDGGRTYTFSEAEDWLREAGFSHTSRLNLKLPRSIGVVIGEKN
jgi:predicted O-methyltransferase YrrM